MSTSITLELVKAHNAELIRKAEAAALVRLAKAERRRARQERRAAAADSKVSFGFVRLHRAVHA